MIYPQCYNGTMIPFISVDGFLNPCCQLNKLLPKIKTVDGIFIDNPFYDDDFSLYKKTYLEIVNSDKWNHTIESLHHTKIKKCWDYCSYKTFPINSSLRDISDISDYKNQKIYTKDINHIQIETTNRCNLNCRYCSRFNIEKEFLNKDDLSIDILIDVLRSKQWINILDCGTYGDSIFYKFYHELLELMHTCIIDNYKLSTAATGKPQKWWDKTQELWKSLNDSGINVIIFWGIDGLEATSKIHRENQDWNEIFNNMRLAAKNNVECIWQFIPFSHNEHQIEEARKIALDIGVTFYLKPSDRFRGDDPLKPKNKNLYYDIEIKDNVKIVKNIPISKFEGTKID